MSPHWILGPEPLMSMQIKICLLIEIPALKTVLSALAVTPSPGNAFPKALQVNVTMNTLVWILLGSSWWCLQHGTVWRQWMCKEISATLGYRRGDIKVGRGLVEGRWPSYQEAASRDNLAQQCTYVIFPPASSEIYHHQKGYCCPSIQQHAVQADAGSRGSRHDTLIQG